MKLADLYDFDPQANREESRKRRFWCPLPACAGKPQDKNHRTLIVFPEGNYYCQRCKEAGLLDDFKTERPKMPPKEYTLAKVRRIVGSIPQPKAEEETPEERAKWREKIRDLKPLRDTEGARYLAGRGIPVEVAHASGVRFGSPYGRPAVVFPIRDTGDKLVGFNSRNIVGNRKMSGGKIGAGVFSAKCPVYTAIGGVVILTEAPIDALSLATCGYPAFALCGLSDRDLLDAIHPRATVWLGFDADTAGNEACDKWAAELKHYGRVSKRLSPPDGFKDWNEALTKMEREALREFLQERIALPAREDTSQDDEDIFGNDAELREYLKVQEALKAEEGGIDVEY